MMYAYKINIDYNYKKITYTREVELPDRLLSIEDISKHLKNGEKFYFDYREDANGADGTYYVIFQGVRDETKKEYEKRIAKGEAYNKRYDEFHKKYPKKNNI